jgi:mannose-6-phosphate isomerase-like protein (cupin superfamily)
MAIRSRYAEIAPYTTKDGSTIRELMHPDVHGNRRQSLAEATLPPGMTTMPHRHRWFEEIYYFLDGEGVMRLGEERLTVRAGDTVCIPKGVPHQLENTGPAPLRLLCCCAPAYAHEDTELIEGTVEE